MNSSDKIKSFYDNEVIREWERMERHPLEYGVTKRYMEKYYPPNAKVLDVGGGPGRYSIMLAKKGYDMTLVDISPKNVEFAKNKALEEKVTIKALCADALELSRYVRGEFDIVQCMGPLYHLIDEKDRLNCVGECLTRLKSGGLFVASFISSYAFLADAIAKYPQVIGDYKEYFLNLNEDKVNLESDENPGFTDAYFTYPKNIERFFESFGLEKLVVAGVEGLPGLAEPAIRELPADVVEDWVEVAYSMSLDELTWGANQHFLYMGKKNG